MEIRRPRLSEEYRAGKTEAARQLQGEAFLKGLHGKVLPPALVDVLYDNWFAVGEMGAGRLLITRTADGQNHIAYTPPVDPNDLSPTMPPIQD